VIASYEHPHFGRWAAATTRELSAPAASAYVGSLPDLELATSLGRWLGEGLGAAEASAHPWAGQLVPGRVTVHGATNAAGERLWFVHNWGFEPQTVTPPMAVTDLGGQPQGPIELGAWDVRILKEATG
jgi:beta-galactosidase